MNGHNGMFCFIRAILLWFGFILFYSFLETAIGVKLNIDFAAWLSLWSCVAYFVFDVVRIYKKNTKLERALREKYENFISGWSIDPGADAAVVPRAS